MVFLTACPFFVYKGSYKASQGVGRCYSLDYQSTFPCRTLYETNRRIKWVYTERYMG